MIKGDVMYNTLCKRNTIFQIFTLSIINVIVAICFKVPMIIIIPNIIASFLFFKLSLTFWDKKILFRMNPLIWFVLPVTLFSLLPIIAKTVSEIQTIVIVSGYSLFIGGVLVINFFACHATKNLGIKAFNEINPIIRELSKTDADYIYLKTNEPIHLAKNNFRFFYGAIEHNNVELSLKSIKEYLSINNKHLEDLTDDDVDVIKMMNI